MNEKKHLKKATMSGLIWTFTDFFAAKGIMFIIQLILARLLLPEHFGLIGMILIVVAVSQSIVDSGMQNALIREKSPTQVDYSTVFYFNLVISILLYVAVFFGAPLISGFYNQPDLTQLLRVLGIVIIINSFSIVQRTMLTRDINFKTQTVINLISTIISGIISITAAILGFGVWSLVIQNVITQLLQALLLTMSNKWIPSFTFSMSSFKRLFGFGWKLLVSGLINTLYLNIYNVLIGKMYSANTLGYYTQGKMLVDISSQSITSAVQKVTYPVLSKMQDDETRLLNGYRTIIKQSTFTTFPLMVGLAATADTFIPLLFGEKWLNTVSYFQILCLAGMFFPLHAINLNMLQVKGRSDLFLKLEIVKKIIGTLLISIVIFLELGIFGLVWTAVLTSIISFFINSFYSGRLLQYSSKQQLIDIAKTFVSTTIMGIAVLWIGEQITGLFLVVELVIQIIVGIVLFLLSSLILKASELKLICTIVYNKLNKGNNETVD